MATAPQNSDIVAVHAVAQVIVDHSFCVSPQALDELAIPTGSYAAVDAATIDALLNDLRVAGNEEVIHVAGTCTNTVRTLRQMGLSCLVSTSLGIDPAADRVKDQFCEEGIALNADFCGLSTARCLALIDPDGERSFRTAHGAASLFPVGAIERMHAQALWTIIDGYLVACQGDARASLKQLCQQIKFPAEQAITTNAGKLLVTVPASVVAARHRESLIELFSAADLVVGNLEELTTVFNLSSIEQLSAAFQDLGVDAIVTDGARGSYLIVSGSPTHAAPSEHIPALDVVVVDSTGAGDAFLAGVIFGLHNKQSLSAAANLGTKFAAIKLRIRGPFIGAGISERLEALSSA